MTPLAGYADKLSVRPGETIRFHVASRGTGPVSASLVRVVSADPNPAGPGIVEAAVASPVREVRTPAMQHVPLGSYAIVENLPPISAAQDFTLVALICPTLLKLPAKGWQGIICRPDANALLSLQLSLDQHGHLIGQFGAVTARQTAPLELDRWARVSMAYDAAARSLTVTQQALTGNSAPVTARAFLTAQPQQSAMGPLYFGAQGAAGGNPVWGYFNGRIEAPAIYAGLLTGSQVVAATLGKPVDAPLIAAWDFSREMSSSRIIDTGPGGHHGRLVNQPTRAVTGHNWDGSEMCWRHAASQYAAIHFHDDDIDDCHWPVTHEWTVPKDFKSGAYALRLTADFDRVSGATAENIPFFVVPPKGKPSAKIAVLVSTFTYTVYGNHARPEWMYDPKWRDDWMAQAKAWSGKEGGAYPHNPGDHRDLGLSTYNFHTDGSGIAYASWHRPMLNLRIGYVTYPYPDIRGSGLRHYPADSHLLAWLEHKGHAYDIITDWELHHEGHALLKQYQTVLTGSHPEYHTAEMLDALTAYRDGGGRFGYLGGNGFYWKIALNPEKPGVIEIRRGEGGIRAWAAEVGEYYNAFDGQYGGLWRRNGRPPQKLAGVGFSAQGNFVGSHYRLRPEAKDPRVTWMFAGIKGDKIGAHGLSGHGAAGFELDRADKKLGTPAHALVLASSEDHPPDAPWVLVPEEQLTHLTTTIPGAKHRDLIHADLTFFETPNGGAVFSVGSITFCGSLPTNRFDNDISQLLDNVVRRFLDPKPFTMPGS
jgi:N,N-dimethylformamidase